MPGSIHTPQSLLDPSPASSTSSSSSVTPSTLTCLLVQLVVLDRLRAKKLFAVGLDYEDDRTGVASCRPNFV